MDIPQSIFDDDGLCGGFLSPPAGQSGQLPGLPSGSFSSMDIHAISSILRVLIACKQFEFAEKSFFPPGNHSPCSYFFFFPEFYHFPDTALCHRPIFPCLSRIQITPFAPGRLLSDSVYHRNFLLLVQFLYSIP